MWVNKPHASSSNNNIITTKQNTTNTVWYHYNMVNFLPNPPQKTPIAHPWRRGMGVSFVSLISDKFCVSHCSAVYIIMSYWATFNQHSTRIFYGTYCWPTISFFIHSLHTSLHITLNLAGNCPHRLLWIQPQLCQEIGCIIGLKFPYKNGLYFKRASFQWQI